eukprot:GHVS01022249.1.p4 GENE.GHVS01022249.1~~GHVS01022249.1.p4  ORF type:complete len:101 (+),score=15.53 GHVS01022249.1:981-1283(+)
MTASTHTHNKHTQTNAQIHSGCSLMSSPSLPQVHGGLLPPPPSLTDSTMTTPTITTAPAIPPFYYLVPRACFFVARLLRFFSFFSRLCFVFIFFLHINNI